MNPDLFLDRMTAFRNFYYGSLMNKQFVVFRDKDKEIINDEELWDGARLDENKAFEKHAIALIDLPSDDLLSFAKSTGKELGEANYIISKHIKPNPRGIEGVFSQVDAVDRCQELEERLAMVDCDAMSAPEFKQLQSDYKKLKKQFKETGVNPEAEAKLEELNRTVIELNQTLEGQKEYILELEKRPELTEEQERMFQESLDNYDAVVAEKQAAEREAEAVKAEKERVEKEKLEAEKKARELEEEIAPLKSLPEKVNKYETENKDLKMKNALLETSVDDKDHEIVEAKETIKLAEKAKSDVEADYKQKLADKEKAHSEEKSKLETDINSLMKDIKTAKADAENKQATLQKTEKDLLDLSNKYDALMQEKQDIEDNQKTLVEEAVKAKEEELAKQYGATVEDRVAEINALKEDNVQKQSRINEYEGQVAQLNHAAEARKQKLTELNKELEEIKSDLKEKKEKADKVPELQSKIEQYDAELLGLRDTAKQVAALQSAKEQYEAEITDLKEQKEKDEEELANKNQRVQDLVEQIRTLEESAETTNKELEDLRTKGHEDTEVVSKARYDADVASRDERISVLQQSLVDARADVEAGRLQLDQQRTNLAEALQKAVDSKDEFYTKKLDTQASEFKQKLEKQKQAYENAAKKHDEKHAAERRDLFDETIRLQELLEQARQNAFADGMTIISVEDKERLEADVARLQEQLENTADPGAAFVDQSAAIHEKDTKIRELTNAVITRNDLLINKNAEITRLQQDYRDLESRFNQVSEEHQAIVNAQASQGSEEESIVYSIFDKLDELAELYDLSFAENANIVNYLDFVEHLKEQKTNSGSADDTIILESGSAEPAYQDPEPESEPESEPVYESAASEPTQESATEPSVETPAPEPEPVTSGASASIDDAVASADPSADPSAGQREQSSGREQQFSQSEQAWYNVVGYALKQSGEAKKSLLTSYLNNSGIENKRVKAYVLGVLAEDAYHKAEFDEALRLNKSAYEACEFAETVFVNSDFDKAQKAKIECNIRVIERKKAA